MAQKVVYQFTEQSKKELIKWAVSKELIFCIGLFLIGFLPVATIENISIGNYYELFLQLVDGVKSIQHLPIVICIIIAYLLVLFIQVLCIIFKKLCIDKLTSIKKTSFIKYMILLAISAGIVALVFSSCSYFAKPYGFKMITPVFIVVIMVVSNLLNKILFSFAIKNCEIGSVDKPVYTTQIKILAAIIRLICLVGICFLVGLLSYCVSGLMVVSDKQIYRFIYYEDFEIGEGQGEYKTIINEEGTEIDWSSSSTTPLIVKGEAYHYYKYKLEELKEEFVSMMPEGNSEKELEEFEENMKALAEQIEIYSRICESRSYSYEQLNFDFVNVRFRGERFNFDTFKFEEYWYTEELKRAYEYIYNAAPDTEDPVKWGKEYGLIEKLLYREKIELSESEFAVGTDFSKTEIVATVKYGDGSIRIAVIKPSNLEELNSAKAGKQVVKWSDSWGEYETTIELVP